MRKHKILSEEYYINKIKWYSHTSIFWIVVAVIYLVLAALTKNGFSVASSMIAVAISAIYNTRSDSLKENYTLYKKNSEQKDGGDS